MGEALKKFVEEGQETVNGPAERAGMRFGCRGGNGRVAPGQVCGQRPFIAAQHSRAAVEKGPRLLPHFREVNRLEVDSRPPAA